ncbi:MAG: hypothetical protein O3A74_01460 [archaeon]|nr:hypothetical protein [archaeon]
MEEEEWHFVSTAANHIQMERDSADFAAINNLVKPFSNGYAWKPNKFKT